MNKVGHVTLAKAMLIAMLVYHMQTCWVPQTMCNDMDKIIRSLVWKGGDERGLHLVSWDMVTWPKHDRDLGLRKARVMNIAMLGKLIAKLHSDSANL